MGCSASKTLTIDAPTPAEHVSEVKQLVSPVTEPMVTTPIATSVVRAPSESSGAEDAKLVVDEAIKLALGGPDESEAIVASAVATALEPTYTLRLGFREVPITELMTPHARSNPRRLFLSEALALLRDPQLYVGGARKPTDEQVCDAFKSACGSGTRLHPAYSISVEQCAAMLAGLGMH